MNLCLFEDDYFKGKKCDITCDSYDTCTRKGKAEYIEQAKEWNKERNLPKHTAEELKIMQGYDLDTKIRLSKDRIQGWYENFDGNVYVSISGGKDSQVLAHLVKSMYPDVPLVFVNTGLEYDSVRLKGQELADEVLTPSMSFVEVIKKYGYPIISKEVSQAVDEGKKYLKALQEMECPSSLDRQTDRQTDRQNFRMLIA